MGYDKMICASIKVVNPSVVELHPGGTYNLNENNQVETAVVKLHMLAQFCDMMAEAWSYSGENNVLMGEEVEVLADKLFDEYRPFIEAGFNIFGLDEFYNCKQLNKYKRRPIVNGYMNAAPGEEEEGVPAGWWYEFPGQLQKAFDFGLVVVDEDECVRIGVYEKSTDEQPIDWIDISQRGNYSQIHRKYPDICTELILACEYIYNQNHI
jgi:hypothetical protein